MILIELEYVSFERQVYEPGQNRPWVLGTVEISPFKEESPRAVWYPEQRIVVLRYPDAKVSIVPQEKVHAFVPRSNQTANFEVGSQDAETASFVSAVLSGEPGRGAGAEVKEATPGHEAGDAMAGQAGAPSMASPSRDALADQVGISQDDAVHGGRAERHVRANARNMGSVSIKEEQLTGAARPRRSRAGRK